MKKSFYMLGLLLLCVPAVSVRAEENTVWKYDDLNMRLEREGEVSGDVEVPSVIDGHEVTALGSGSFNDQHSVTSITFPSSIEALQSGSICFMDGLEKVQLSENLTTIESGNFSDCPALTSVTVPASVSYIESSFCCCENLKEIRFEGVCPIFGGNDWNFDGLPDECVIYVPDDQFDVYAEALADANNAADRLQPSGKNAVTVDFTAPEEDFEFDPANGTITGYTGSSARLEVPSEIDGVPVRAIGDEAFYSCYYIYYVTIPEGVETIGTRSFRQACNLGYVSFPSTLKTIGEEAFCNAQIGNIEWREGLEEIGPRAFCYDHETVLTLPSTVRNIGESAFENSRCSELYLSGDLEKIDSRAFAGTSLYYMVFDLYEPVDIAPDAFADNYIEDLDLPWDSSFENRDAYAAMLKEQCPDCTVWINNPVSGGVAEYPDLEAVTITDDVWAAYSGETADLTIWVAYNDIEVTALGDALFKGNKSIRSFYPHHCGWFTTIGKEAFADSSVEYVELFGSITTIGDGAFQNCGNMTELTIPASVTSIGKGVLAGCMNLRKLTVLCDPSILPLDFLADCTGLEEIYAASDASDEQIDLLGTLAGRPWYHPVTRTGEAPHEVQVMPYEPLPGEDFWYDEEYNRLDSYEGYEVNLVLPREIDGVPLTMVGGGMMNRASYGDNYEMELPVRSLVIPETYTELPSYVFENCETLETVICYAPVENLREGTFHNCTNLREVIFVNGVRNLENYVFRGCPSLETVYLGEYVEEVSESAFQNEDGSIVFALEDCLTSPDQMPDVDALLAAVKSDPIPAPEPETEPIAVPIGEEGAAFFGTWYGKTMEMEGEVIGLEEFGMTMQLTLNADGTAEMFDGEAADMSVWSFSNGIAYIDTMQGALTDSGELCLEEDGVKVNFSREIPENGTKPITKSEPEAAIGSVKKTDLGVGPESENVMLVNEKTVSGEDACDNLAMHRQTLLDTNSICGVIFLGYVDGSADDRSCLKQVLYDRGNMDEFPFLSDIPDERIVGNEYGSELYCIFPYDQNASVAVNEYVYDGPDDYIGRAGNVLYRSEYGDPIILRCNASDIIRDTEITIVDSQRNVLVWQPGLNLNDGSVDVPWEEPYVYDVTYGTQDDWCMEKNFGLSVMQVVNCQEWVSLRQEPDVNSARLDMVPLGAILRNCFRASEEFYYVEYNGLSGYVHGDYLKELPSPQGEASSEYPKKENGYLFGMEGEWETDVLVQENGTDMVYTLQFLTDESGVEGELTFSFDDPWSDSVSTWYGTYFAYNPAEYTCGMYMYFLDTPDGQRYGEIYVALEDNTMTITEVSGDAFWPFTSNSTETLRFYPYR